MSNAVKNDSEKIRIELFPADALEMISEVLTYGATKYSDHNWAKGFDWSRLLGACQRHLTAYSRGEDNDPETGLSHIAHAACSLAFLLVHIRRGLGKDDRLKFSDAPEAFPDDWAQSYSDACEKLRKTLEDQTPTVKLSDFIAPIQVQTIEVTEPLDLTPKITCEAPAADAKEVIRKIKEYQFYTVDPAITNERF